MSMGATISGATLGPNEHNHFIGNSEEVHMSHLHRFSSAPARSAIVCLVGLGSVFGLLSAASPAAANGPVAYFPFNGSTEDASGFGNHAVSMGAVPTEDRFGNPNSAYLVGSFGHLEAADSDSLEITDAFTIAAWFRQDDMISSDAVLASKRMNTAYSVFVFYGESWVCPDPAAERGIQVTMGGSAIRFTDGPFFDCGTGEWRHVAVTVGVPSGGLHPISLYVDGSFIETRSMGGVTTNNTAPLGIGIDTGFLRRFAGAIDDLRLYDRELAAGEVTELFNSLLIDGFESGSISAWSNTVP